MRFVELYKSISSSERFIPRAAATFGMKSFGVLAAFILNVLIARTLGADDAGVFYLSLTILMTLGIVVRFGLDNALIKFVSTTDISTDKSRLQNFLFSAILIVCCVGVLVSGTAYLSIDLINDYLFEDIDIKPALTILLLGLLPVGLVWVTSGYLKGLRKPASAALIESSGIPVIAIALMAFFMIYGNATIDLISSSYVVAAFVTSICGILIICKHIGLGVQVNRLEVSGILKTAYPMMLIGLAGFLVTWAPSLFLGSFTDSASVAYYNIAFRTSALMGFVLIVVNSVTSPRFASLYKDGDIEALHSLAVKSAMFITALVSPIAALLIFFPEFVLLLFGEEFIVAADMLIIMTVGQFVNVVTGSVGHILMMTGREVLMRNIMISTAILSISLSIYLINVYGAIGAAFSIAFCMIFRNVVMTWFVYKQLNIVVIPTPANIKKFLFSS